jgi:hypothetical protein
MKKYLCWLAHRKLYVPYKTMIERMVESTFNSSNVHGVVDDNSNPYMNMVIDTMRINNDYAGECPIIYEKSNIDTIRFFGLLKNSDETLWDEYTNHNKLLGIARMFTMKSDYGLSKANYDTIID